ncbi:MAG: M28 family peptidase, partial [Sphingobacteriales bacterium]
IMQVLAGDSLRGRGNGSPDLLKAGHYILDHFRKAGLVPLPGSMSFFHAFLPFGGPKENKRDQLAWNGRSIKAKDFIYLSVVPGTYEARELNGFQVIHADSFSREMLTQYNAIDRNLLIWTNATGNDQLKLEEIQAPAGGIQNARLLVYADDAPVSVLLAPNQSYYNSVEYNIVGVLPGLSIPGEQIVFSAHYDHEGVTESGADRILNGANDNASGTTALLMLADYFALRKDNARTIIFCAFAGEELGLKGSTEMAEQMDTRKIKAGINLEMLGIPQYGKKKVFITGSRYSRLPNILGREFKQQGLKLVKEPNEEKQLYKRSDNYPFAEKGVTFHTIMASDDDDDCYHDPCDEIERIDMDNLAFIIRAIAAGSRGLIGGVESGVGSR